MKKTVFKLKKKLDGIYSQWLRLSAADENGMVTCVTCRKTLHWKEAQCSHYVSRSHNSTRYLHENTHVACIGCNLFKAGNMDEYTLFMIETYGVDFLYELNQKKNEIKRFTIPELEEMIALYSKLTKELT